MESENTTISSICVSSMAHSSQVDGACPIRYAAQCLKSADAVVSAAISHPSRFSQTSDDLMTSFAMTEPASFYFKLRNTRADRSPAKKTQGAAITLSGVKHKLFPSVLPAMP